MKEGYSREAFDANEKKIDEVRKKASLKPFGGKADPSDIMSAKFDYLAGRQKRDGLLGLAHEEALKENDERLEKTGMRIGDYKGLIIETESGNRYIIQRKQSGEGYLIANFNTGVISEVESVELENTSIVKDGVLLLGSAGHTSPVKSAKGYK